MQTKREIFEQIGLDLDERFMEAVMETEVKPRGLLPPPLGDSWDVSVRKLFFQFLFFIFLMMTIESSIQVCVWIKRLYFCNTVL